jgi:transcriptional regulator with XRE-family HTH domain
VIVKRKMNTRVAKWNTMADLTPEANRAARAILKWSVRELADNAGIAFSTVHRFETTGTATDATKEKIKAAYAAHDVEITNGEFTGARLRLKPVTGHT